MFSKDFFNFRIPLRRRDLLLKFSGAVWLLDFPVADIFIDKMRLSKIQFAWLCLDMGIQIADNRNYGILVNTCRLVHIMPTSIE